MFKNFPSKHKRSMIIFTIQKQQAGTGPSRRHIQCSKIAKGHQSFKVFSSTALKFCFKKVSQRQKKLKGGTLWDFSIPCLSQNPKKRRGTLWGKIFSRKKVSQHRNKLKGVTFWPRPALNVMRETFWFCSLGQQVKFEILWNFLVELFWSV